MVMRSPVSKPGASALRLIQSAGGYPLSGSGATAGFTQQCFPQPSPCPPPRPDDDLLAALLALNLERAAQ
jgi:hypothetical protein